MKTIIEPFPKETRIASESRVLRVAELYTDTVQGEGQTIGVPATFLRLQGCTLNCVWCDSKEVWRQGNPYGVTELLELMEKEGVLKNLRQKQHLVITGGSPLLQQDILVEFIREMQVKFQVSPTIEVENECVLIPKPELLLEVDYWNNSPKLTTSGMQFDRRFKPEVIKFMHWLSNSTFKFVITCEADWEEIESNFLKQDLIRKDQIILMPAGMTQDELRETYPVVFEMATKHNVRMCDRLHITLFNRKVTC